MRCLPQLKATRTKRRLGLLGSVSSRISSAVLNLKFVTGFYSLFSVTEEPFVTSGGELRLVRYLVSYRSDCTVDQWMGFYWKDKKDQVRLITPFTSHTMANRHRLVVCTSRPFT